MPRTFGEADDLRGSRFVEADLSGAVMRGVQVEGLDIDAPWLGYGSLLVNGVDVVGFVEAELDRRFPGRGDRTSETPDGLRAAWASLSTAWDSAIARAATMPAGTVDESVDGEWSFAQTLRHLVHAIDVWIGRPVLELDDPFHPLGLGDREDASTAGTPAYADVLAARADRFSIVTDLLATVTEADLDVARPHPRDPDVPETTRSCVHVVLEEGWEHLRFATRDLDALAADGGRTTSSTAEV